MKTDRFTLRYGKTLLYFGPNSITSLRERLSGIRRAYLVTSRNAAKVSGALSEIESYLTQNRVEYGIFNEVVANPTASLVDTIAEKIWRFGADVIIAIGGGSVIDSAKIASVIAVCGGRTPEYLKRARDVCGALELIAVNLTHGTGSEINRIAVATIDETREKVSIASDYLYPLIAIDDPRYLITLPKNQTIYTAIDAFYHALEASTSRASSPFTRTLCEAVVQLIVRWLPIAVKKPYDIEARYWLLYASTLAGIAVDNSRTHLIHAIEHVLSGLEPSLAHGSGLASIGPAAIKLLYRHVPEVLYELLKHLDSSLNPDPSDAEKAAEAVRKFQMEVGFREHLTDYGFTAEMAERVSEMAFKSMAYLLELSPIDVNRDLLRGLYLEVLSGLKA
ncbi:MAG: iron-containing alcohol dehydrogenase [Sulfolobales archaeon]